MKPSVEFRILSDYLTVIVISIATRQNGPKGVGGEMYGQVTSSIQFEPLCSETTTLLLLNTLINKEGNEPQPSLAVATTPNSHILWQPRQRTNPRKIKGPLKAALCVFYAICLTTMVLMVDRLAYYPVVSSLPANIP